VTPKNREKKKEEVKARTSRGIEFRKDNDPSEESKGKRGGRGPWINYRMKKGSGGDNQCRISRSEKYQFKEREASFEGQTRRVGSLGGGNTPERKECKSKNERGKKNSKTSVEGHLRGLEKMLKKKKGPSGQENKIWGCIPEQTQRKFQGGGQGGGGRGKKEGAQRNGKNQETYGRARFDGKRCPVGGGKVDKGGKTRSYSI